MKKTFALVTILSALSLPAFAADGAVAPATAAAPATAKAAPAPAKAKTEKPKHFYGSVISVDDASKKITVKVGKKDETFALGDVKVMKAKKEIQVADLKAGDRVSGSAVEKDGEATLKSLTVTRSAKAKPAAPAPRTAAAPKPAAPAAQK